MDGSKLAKMPIGAMTQALLTAVSRLGPNATVLQIYNHMRRSLVVDGYTQKPQLSTGHKTSEPCVSDACLRRFVSC